jgi:putative MFS transporter
MSSAFMPEFWSFSIARAVCGVGIGMSIPILTAYNSEVCPAKLRGSYIIIVNIFFPLGQVLIILVAFVLTPNLDGG